MDREALIALIALYRGPMGNVTGGHLHIVLDGDNIDDGCIRYCVKQALIAAARVGVKQAIIAEDYVAAAIGKALLATPEDERAEIVAYR